MAIKDGHKDRVEKLCVSQFLWPSKMAIKIGWKELRFSQFLWQSLMGKRVNKDRARKKPAASSPFLSFFSCANALSADAQSIILVPRLHYPLIHLDELLLV